MKDVNEAPQIDDDLYREIILDHYRHPRHKGKVAAATGSIAAENPTCGDQIDLSVRIKDGRVEAAGFDGRGCSISQAAASMLCDSVNGRDAAEAVSLASGFRRLLTEGSSPADLGDLDALAGVRAYPVRIKCALLSCNALLQLLGEEVDGDGS